MILLPETQAAAKLGFLTMGDFERALANKEIPAFAKTIRHGRRKVRMWSEKDINEWIDGEDVDEARTRKDLAIASLG